MLIYTLHNKEAVCYNFCQVKRKTKLESKVVSEVFFLRVVETARLSHETHHDDSCTHYSSQEVAGAITTGCDA